jgi:DNA-binding NarL/FixJ family response regulator
MADPDAHEKVMHLMNEILDQQKRRLNNQISSMLEAYSRRSGKTIEKGEQEDTSKSAAQNEIYHAVTVYMDGQDWEHFASLGYHLGIAPSIMALIILKQVTLRAKDGNGIENFLPFSTGTSPQAPHLFPREMETLVLIAKGHSNKEIARTLDISERTVKNHVTSIMRKFKAQNRTQVVIMAQQYHLV